MDFLHESIEQDWVQFYSYISDQFYLEPKCQNQYVLADIHTLVQEYQRNKYFPAQWRTHEFENVAVEQNKCIQTKKKKQK